MKCIAELLIALNWLSLQTVMAASDSEIDENAIHDVEADLESVYVYLTEGKYHEGVSANQKRVIDACLAVF